MINYGVAGTIQDSIGGAPTRSIVLQVKCLFFYLFIYFIRFEWVYFKSEISYVTL